ncbi:mediator of RNA polymerase II transcription subunit 1 [Petromyzon marinus]|uniref:mediator of RNA polymerase II transcription subunit 1 n=1 Tax=Petromyzon marinus TaxID=7757 RepID=UPI003F6F2264
MAAARVPSAREAGAAVQSPITLSPEPRTDTERLDRVSALMERLRAKHSVGRPWSDTFKLVRQAMEKRMMPESGGHQRLLHCLETIQKVLKVNSLPGMVDRLEALAKHNGLASHLGPTGKECYITSDMFYLEVQMEPSGVVSDVRVAHHGEINPASCPELTQILREGNLEEFSKHLEGLASLYKLPGDSKLKTKVYLALQSLEMDLAKMAQMHRAATNVSVEEVILQGVVGYVSPRMGGHLMTLKYFVSPYDLLDEKTKSTVTLNDNNVPRLLGMNAHVMIEATTGPFKLPIAPLIAGTHPIDGTGMPSFSAISNANSIDLPACFYLKFPQPLPLSDTAMQQIQTKTGIPVTHVDTMGPLFELIGHVTQGQTPPPQPGSSTEHAMYYCVVLPDQRHCYFLNKRAVRQDGRELVGALVRQVPFSHPSHVPAVLAAVRRQLIYNALLDSCMRRCLRTGITDDMSDYYQFEVSPLADYSFTVTFQHPLTDSMACVVVDVTESWQPCCTVHTGLLDPPICPDLYLTRVIQRCLSVPVAMRAMNRKALEIQASAPELQSRPETASVLAAMASNLSATLENLARRSPECVPPPPVPSGTPPMHYSSTATVHTSTPEFANTQSAAYSGSACPAFPTGMHSHNQNHLHQQSKAIVPGGQQQESLLSLSDVDLCKVAQNPILTSLLQVTGGLGVAPALGTQQQQPHNAQTPSPTLPTNTKNHPMLFNLLKDFSSPYSGSDRPSSHNTASPPKLEVSGRVSKSRKKWRSRSHTSPRDQNEEFPNELCSMDMETNTEIFDINVDGTEMERQESDSGGDTDFPSSPCAHKPGSLAHSSPCAQRSTPPLPHVHLPLPGFSINSPHPAQQQQQSVSSLPLPPYTSSPHPALTYPGVSQATGLPNQLQQGLANMVANVPDFLSEIPLRPVSDPQGESAHVPSSHVRLSSPLGIGVAHLPLDGTEKGSNLLAKCLAQCGSVSTWDWQTVREKDSCMSPAENVPRTETLPLDAEGFEGPSTATTTFTDPSQFLSGAGSGGDEDSQSFPEALDFNSDALNNAEPVGSFMDNLLDSNSQGGENEEKGLVFGVSVTKAETQAFTSADSSSRVEVATDGSQSAVSVSHLDFSTATGSTSGQESKVSNILSESAPTGHLKTEMTQSSKDSCKLTEKSGTASTNKSNIGSIQRGGSNYDGKGMKRSRSSLPDAKAKDKVLKHRRLDGDGKSTSHSMATCRSLTPPANIGSEKSPLALPGRSQTPPASSAPRIPKLTIQRSAGGLTVSKTSHSGSSGSSKPGTPHISSSSPLRQNVGSKVPSQSGPAFSTATARGQPGVRLTSQSSSPRQGGPQIKVKTSSGGGNSKSGTGSSGNKPGPVSHAATGNNNGRGSVFVSSSHGSSRTVQMAGKGLSHSLPTKQGFLQKQGSGPVSYGGGSKLVKMKPIVKPSTSASLSTKQTSSPSRSKIPMTSDHSAAVKHTPNIAKSPKIRVLNTSPASSANGGSVANPESKPLSFTTTSQPIKSGFASQVPSGGSSPVMSVGGGSSSKVAKSSIRQRKPSLTAVIDKLKNGVTATGAGLGGAEECVDSKPSEDTAPSSSRAQPANGGLAQTVPSSAPQRISPFNVSVSKSDPHKRKEVEREGKSKVVLGSASLSTASTDGLKKTLEPKVGSSGSSSVGKIIISKPDGEGSPSIKNKPPTSKSVDSTNQATKQGPASLKQAYGSHFISESSTPKMDRPSPSCIKSPAYPQPTGDSCSESESSSTYDSLSSEDGGNLLIDLSGERPSKSNKKRRNKEVNHAQDQEKLHHSTQPENYPKSPLLSEQPPLSNLSFRSGSGTSQQPSPCVIDDDLMNEALIGSST